MRNPTTVLDPTRRNTEATSFANALHRNIVGQDQAIEEVSLIYQTFLAGLNPPGRPVANLLFLGTHRFWQNPGGGGHGASLVWRSSRLHQDRLRRVPALS